jgi:hypothetical protein
MLISETSNLKYMYKFVVAYSNTFNKRDLFIWKSFLVYWSRFSYVHNLSTTYNI